MPTPATSIELPEKALPDLKRIAGIDEARFDALMNAVRETEPALRKAAFLSKLSSKLPDFDEEDVQSVIRAAFILYRIKERTGLSGTELSELISQSTSKAAEEDFPASKRETLKARLAVLLNLDKSLGVSAKALDVMTEHQHIYCAARILSDIRPVFTEQLESPSAMIIHNLQLGYHEDGRHHDFYVALDTDDLTQLKKVIERAEKKNDALVSVLNAAKIRYLEV